MSTIEAIAALLGLVNVTLVVFRSIWNYPFGIAMVVLYCYVFFGAHLYSDALLQIFFFVVQFYGWWNWSRAAASEGEVRVDYMANAARGWWTVGCVVVIAIWGAIMHRYTDASFPWWDATIAILSVAAQIMMSQRKIENWVLWIVVNVLSIGLYAVKGLWLTTALYMVFLALAIWGLIDWRGVNGRDGARTRYPA